MNNFSLTSRTKELVENFAKINQTMLFREGNTLRTISPDEDVVGFGHIEETIPQKFAVYDLGKFLGILGLYEKPELNVQDKTVLISDDKRKFSYTLAAENQILSPSVKAKEALSKSCSSSAIASFDITGKELTILKKNVAIADLPDIALVSDGVSISIRALDGRNSTSDVYSVVLAQRESPTFNLKFVRRKFESLLDEDYTVTISPKAVYFKGKDVEYFICPEAE